MNNIEVQAGGGNGGEGRRAAVWPRRAGQREAE